MTEPAETPPQAADFDSGMRVRYVPHHAHGDRFHPDCQDGRVSSRNTSVVFVRFDKQVNRIGWVNATAEACSPEDLVRI